MPVQKNPVVSERVLAGPARYHHSFQNPPPHREEGLSLILLLDSCSQQTHCSTARTPLDGGLSPSLICFARRCTLFFLYLSPASVVARIFCRPLRPVSEPR